MKQVTDFMFQRLPFAMLALFFFSIVSCTPEEDDEPEPDPIPDPVVAKAPTYNADDEDLHFFHAWLANCINDQYGGATAPTESALESTAKQRIQDAAASSTISGEYGTTQLVWGPQLTVNPSTASLDNGASGLLMYCLKSTSAEGEEHYYVGIGGTNNLAVYGLYFQDLNVGSQSAWESNKGNVAAGAKRGFDAINGFTDASKSLKTFLEDAAAANTDNKTYIDVAGHGLGGAMAQLYASSLANNIDNDRVEVSAWIYGAPAIGDAAFGTALVSDLSNRYNAYTGSLDVLAHAFATSDLNEVCGIYSGKALCDNDLSPSLEINGIMRMMVGNSTSGSYAEVGTPTNFNSTLPSYDDCSALRLAIDLWWYEGGDVYININDINHHCEGGSNISFTQFSRYFYFTETMGWENTWGYLNNFVSESSLRTAITTYVPKPAPTVEDAETQLVDLFKATNTYLDANSVTDCDCD